MDQFVFHELHDQNCNEIIAKLRRGAVSVQDHDVSVSVVARVPAQWSSMFEKRSKKLYEQRSDARELVLLKTKLGLDSNVVRAALAGKLPPGFFGCKNVGDALERKGQMMPSLAQRRRVQELVQELTARDEEELPSFTVDFAALIERLEKALARATLHVLDTSFERLMHRDALVRVLDFLPLPPKPGRRDLARLARTCRIWAGAVRVWATPERRAQVELELRVSKCMGTADLSKTELLQRCPALAPHLDQLARTTYTHSKYKNVCSLFPIVAVVRSFCLIFGNAAAAVLDGMQAATLKRQRQTATRKRKREDRRCELLTHLGDDVRQYDERHPMVRDFLLGKSKSAAQVASVLQEEKARAQRRSELETHLSALGLTYNEQQRTTRDFLAGQEISVDQVVEIVRQQSAEACERAKARAEQEQQEKEDQVWLRAFEHDEVSALARMKPGERKTALMNACRNLNLKPHHSSRLVLQFVSGAAEMSLGRACSYLTMTQTLFATFGGGAFANWNERLKRAITQEMREEKARQGQTDWQAVWKTVFKQFHDKIRESAHEDRHSSSGEDEDDCRWNGKKRRK